jgi:hypothetical protein
MRAVLVLGLASLVAAKAATVRIPAPIVIDDASVTVAPRASAAPGVTAYAFSAQQSGVASASYDVEDAGDTFRWHMTMTIDGVVRNESEYHQTMTMEQVCGVVTMDADGEAAMGGKIYLDPCTITANSTTGVGSMKRTFTTSQVMSHGIAGLAGLGKSKQAALVLDTVTVAGGKFVDASATPASSGSLHGGDGVDANSLEDWSSKADDLTPTTIDSDVPKPAKTDSKTSTTAPSPKPSNQKSAGSSVAAMVVPALLGLGVVLAL